MNYLILAAGKGISSSNVAHEYPKSMYRLKDTTILERMIDLIKKYDVGASIYVVTGFMCEMVESKLDGVTIIRNPFYEVTSSMASVWFAKELKGLGELTIINGDIVVSEDVVKDFVTKKVERPTLLVDTAIQKKSNNNVRVDNNHLVCIQKNIVDLSGEYAGIICLDSRSCQIFFDMVNQLVLRGFYNEWFEEAVNQLIICENYAFYCEDICDYQWLEISSMIDLVEAQRIR